MDHRSMTDTDESTTTENHGESEEEEDTDREDPSFPEMNLLKFCPKETEKDNPPEKVIQDFIDSFRPKENDHREDDTPVKEPITAKAAGGAKRSLFGENSKKESNKFSVDKEDGRTRTNEPLFKELKLNEATKRKIDVHPSKYQVKMFVITSKNDSPMSLAVNSIVDCSQIMETSNATRSFMMFFYKDGDPDIFVMTSGPAYKRLQSRCCPQFPKRVARRVLEFKTIKIETRNVTGKQQQTRTIFRPNCPEVPNILDLIHVIVQTYTASPNVASSLYDLTGFENVKESQFTITQWGLKAHTSLSITEMVSFITHIADIDRGEETYVCEKRLIDNGKYEHEKYEFITDDPLKSNLERRLLLVLNDPENKNIIDIKDEAEEYSLYRKGIHIPINTWSSPPTLHNILEALTDHITTDYLRIMQLQCGPGKRIPLTDYLNGTVTRNDVQYSLRKGVWYGEDNQRADGDLSNKLTKQIVGSQFQWNENVISLNIPNSAAKYHLFENRKQKSYATWRTTPSFRDVLIALVEQKTEIVFEFSWFIENVQLKMITGKKEKRKKIRYCVKENPIHFTYGGDSDSYIYSLKTNTFIKVDKTVTLKEKEDGRFKWFELIQEEKDKQVIEELRKAFDESLKNDSSLQIPLSLPDLTEWPDAGTFKLYLRSRKNPEMTWERMPATLNQVLDGIHDKNKTSLNFLQDDAKFTMQFNGMNTKKRNPITELLVHQMTFEDKPYFFWHGKWLKIKAEYISIVAHTFQNHLQKTNENFLPLPWVFKGTDDNKKVKATDTDTNDPKDSKKMKKKEIESKPFKVEDLLTFMQKTFPKTAEKDCIDLLNSVSDKKDNTSDETMTRTYKAHQYKEDKEKNLILIFLRIHSNLVELLYNTTYILYDRFLSKQGEGFIVGDQILTTNNIEMFDILKYDQKTTYLIHVKDGFGQTVRDVCSQIKNSAKLLFSSMTSQSTRSMLEEMWKTYTSESDGGAQFEYRRATKEKMMKLTRDTFLSLFNTKKRDIVYVLAVRDEKKEVKLEEEEAMEKALSKHYGDQILEALKEHDYVTDQFFGKSILTDKFRLQGKDFIQTMTASMDWGSNYNWNDVLDILQKYLPGTQSTIAQLEIVELFDYFADHFDKKPTLKLFFLPTSLEDLEKAFVPSREE